MKRILAFLLAVCLLLACPFAAAVENAQLDEWMQTTLWLIESGIFPALTLEKGSTGYEVAAYQIKLTTLGYYKGKITGKYDAATVTAVKAFEKANGIKSDGKLSVSEQTLLVQGSSVSAAPAAALVSAPSATVKTEEKKESMVWIPKTGKKYHSKSSCSNMKNPSHVSLSTAKSRGFTPCSKCSPPR